MRNKVLPLVVIMMFILVIPVFLFAGGKKEEKVVEQFITIHWNFQRVLQKRQG